MGESDWAWVHPASPPGRAPLPVHRSGLPDGAEVRILAVQPAWDALALHRVPGGEVRQLECRVNRRTMPFGDGDDEIDPVDSLSARVPLGSCPLVPGHSGSPLLARDSDGIWRVRGLVDRAGDRDRAQAWARSRGIRLLDGRIDDFGFASALACVPMPGEGDSSLPEACRFRLHPRVRAEDEARRGAETEARTRDCPRDLALGRGLRWEGLVLVPWEHPAVAAALRQARDDGAEGWVLPVPACVEAEPADTVLDLPVWSARFGYDRSLRWDFRLDRSGLALPARLAWSRRNGAGWRYDLSARNGLALARGEVASCPDGFR